MKDKRTAVFERSLEELVESLDATLELARRDDSELVPDPLRETASKLVARLGTADRLATGVFQGTVADVARVGKMTEAMRRLASAYIAYRKQLDTPSSVPAAERLQKTLERVRAENLGQR